MAESTNLCIVVGGGDFDSALMPVKHNGDLVIAADSGYSGLKSAGVVPDICIGDFDSLGYEPDDCETLRLPVVKDDTDMVAAAKFGLGREFKRFIFLGVLGGKRFSHSLAAVQTLLWLNTEGADGRIIDSRCEINVRSKGVIKYPAGSSGSISLFSMGEKTVLSLKGFKYELDEYSLTPFFPLGVSNSFTGAEAEITVHEGVVVIVSEPPDIST